MALTSVSRLPAPPRRVLQGALLNNERAGATGRPLFSSIWHETFFFSLSSNFFFRRSNCSCGGKRKEVAAG